MKEMKITLWKDLMEGFHRNFGGGDPHADIKKEPKYSNFQFPQDVMSVNYNGERIVYYGNGKKRIIDFEDGNHWKCYELDGLRWEPTRLDKVGREILRHYYVSMKNLQKN